MHSFPSVVTIIRLLLFLILRLITEVTTDIDNTLRCNFDDGTFCGWRYEPSNWAVGYKAPVLGRYAYIQGSVATQHLDARLLSPLIDHITFDTNAVRVEFLAWKSAVKINVDICLFEKTELLCLETVFVNGLGAWTKYSTILAPLKDNSQVLFRVRNLTTSEDIFGIDDIVIASDNNSIDETLSNTTIFSKYNSKIKSIDTAEESNGKEETIKNSLYEKQFRPKHNVENHCTPVKCTVTEISCQLNLSKYWRRSEGRILVSNVGFHQITTPTFIAPVNDSFLEFNLWMSDDVELTISDSVNSSDTNRELWKCKGQSYGKGWHSVRIPVRTDGLPGKLIFQAKIPAKNFLVISEIKLTNVYGKEVSCDSASINVSTKSDYSRNLTPLKRAQLNVATATNYVAKDPSPIRPQIIRGFLNYHSAGVNSFISSNNNLSNMWHPEKNEQYVTPTASTTQLTSSNRISSTIGNRNVVLIPEILNVGKSLRSPIVFSRLNADADASSQNYQLNVKVARQLQKNRTSLAPTSKSSVTPMSTIVEQPVFIEKIRNFARQLGFPNLTGQQALELLKAILSSKTREKLFGRRKQEDLKASNSTSLINGLQPIKPVNAPPGTEIKLNNDFGGLQLLFPSNFPSLGFLKQEHLLSQNLNSDFLRKIASVFTPPNTQADAQRPLTRQNLDFVIQNANSI